MDRIFLKYVLHLIYLLLLPAVDVSCSSSIVTKCCVFLASRGGPGIPLQFRAAGLRQILWKGQVSIGLVGLCLMNNIEQQFSPAISYTYAYIQLCVWYIYIYTIYTDVCMPCMLYRLYIFVIVWTWAGLVLQKTAGFLRSIVQVCEEVPGVSQDGRVDSSETCTNMGNVW